MSLATSCDITRHHTTGSGSGSGAGGVRCHSTKGVAEEIRGGGSRRQAGVGSGSGRRVIVGSVRGSPYKYPPSLHSVPLAVSLTADTAAREAEVNLQIVLVEPGEPEEGLHLLLVRRSGPFGDTGNLDWIH